MHQLFDYETYFMRRNNDCALRELGDVARGMAKLGVFTHLDQRVNLEWQEVRQVGFDLRITARVLQVGGCNPPLLPSPVNGRGE